MKEEAKQEEDVKLEDVKPKVDGKEGNQTTEKKRKGKDGKMKGKSAKKKKEKRSAKAKKEEKAKRKVVTPEEVEAEEEEEEVTPEEVDPEKEVKEVKPEADGRKYNRSNGAKAKDVKGRNHRVRALMRWNRALKAMNSPGAKTFEEGNKNRIPASMVDEVRADAKKAFEKYFANGCDWDAVIREESRTEETDHSSVGERVWLFEDELFKKKCGKNKVRFESMKANLKRLGFVRYHPDMEKTTVAEKKEAIQYHGLILDKKSTSTSDKHTKKMTGQKTIGSPRRASPPPMKSLKRRTSDCSVMSDDSNNAAKRTATGKDQEGKDHSGKDGKEAAKGTAKKGKDQEGKDGKEASKRNETDADAKAAAAKKKAEIKKKQEAAEAKKKKLEEPAERMKSFLSSCPSLIRELQLATAESKTRKAKSCVPPRFLKEYDYTFAEYLKTLLEVRMVLESNMCQDQEKYIKKVGLETIEKGETKLAMARKTLKSWRNSQHVYQNGIGSGEK